VFVLFLKKLEIQGFKSFADKTALEINSGITSVVGPNGSGKSNISDAIRWVLGEQSVKTLRGSKMEDIIFAGTEHRKPMGFAEVSITIDNSDHTLPIEYSEVTVTRRVYRSGESEYMINRTSCRLKDIYELFLDTGIGKDGYSVIGQGRVDEILSTKSEDRRHIFEEASGIMKFKVRKLESEKKLELTKQNLLRINDIIIELENQLEPLRQQSEVAKKYLSTRENLKELEINVYIENIGKFKEKIIEYEEQYSIISDNIENENKKLEDITGKNKAKTEWLKSLEEKLNSSKDEYYNIEGKLERSNSEIKVNDEKIYNLNQNILRIDNEQEDINEKIAQLTKEDEVRQGKAKYLNKKHEEYLSKLKEYEAQMEAILALLGENERNIEKLKMGIMDKLDLLSDKKTQVNNVKSHIESINKRKENINNEIYSINLEKDKDNIKIEDLDESIYKANAGIKEAESNVNELNRQKNELELKLSDQRKKQNALRSDLQIKGSRYKMLFDMEKNLEGYNRSVRSVLKACKESQELGKGIHGAVAQLISTDKKYETAIEMTLGGALQNIVTSTEEDARKAIEFLKSNKVGRATFLPLTSVNGKRLENSAIDELKGLQGFCGLASDLVSFDPKYKGIVLSLLGKVVVVDSLDDGIKIARKFRYGFRIVTIDGDILSISGSMSGGSSEGRGSGILARNREIPQLREEIEILKKEEPVIEQEIQKVIAQINEISAQITSQESTIRDFELIKVRDESHLGQVKENLKKADAKIDMLKQESGQLTRQEKEIQDELEKYIKELETIEEDISETKRLVAEHQEKHKEDQSARDELHNDITDYKISVNSIVESLESVNSNINRIEEEKEKLVKGSEKKAGEKAKNLQEVESLNAKNEGIRNNIKQYEAEKVGRTLEIDRTTEEKKMIEEEMFDTVNQINGLNKNIVLLKEEYNRLEVRKAKSESEMDAIQNRMWDEYELTYTNAIELKKDIGSITQAQKKINELRNEIKELGPVNVASIEEYIKTKERYEFMSVQRNDMEQAEEKLYKVINEMTTIMKKQFLEQFKLINENFSIVFRELFEGGHAQLILSNKENVLESGIEIEVQPPGKKLQNMMLLSGGERAFTAIALLFAILRLRPTPFCVLDEIEAALDDANVYRFGEYLKKYSGSTQFIMITHRKGTMEASESLYGVTMQEHGISKTVSMKLGERAS
jgi:chromosome segregation protein